jgi:hypothetical protein
MFTFKLFTPNIYLNFVRICIEIIFGSPWTCTIKLFTVVIYGFLQ